MQAWWPPLPQSQPTHFPGCLSAQGTTGKRSGDQGVGQAGTGSLLSRLVGGELRALMASRAQGAGQSVSPTESRLYPLPAGGDVKHGDISTTAMDISFSILFEFYFIFSLYFEALLYYLYRSFHAYVIRASKRQRHC